MNGMECMRNLRERESVHHIVYNGGKSFESQRDQHSDRENGDTANENRET